MAMDFDKVELAQAMRSRLGFRGCDAGGKVEAVELARFSLASLVVERWPVVLILAGGTLAAIAESLTPAPGCNPLRNKVEQMHNGAVLRNAGRPAGHSWLCELVPW